MLHEVSYRFEFAQIGRVVENHLKFDKGVTLITGPNETGKSMGMETVRFAFFGSDALRAPMKSYTKINVTVDWTLKGQRYRVNRRQNGAVLWRLEGKDETALATGTTAVNAVIIKLFGYGLAVFDIAHFCNQGKVEALTDMRPTDRKKMVDRTIGLDALDEAANVLAMDATALRQQVKGMELGLGTCPVAPQRPEGYTRSVDLSWVISEVEEKVNTLRVKQARLKELKTRPALIGPGNPPTDATVSQLAVSEAERDTLRAEQDRLAGLLLGVEEWIGYSYSEMDEMEAGLKACDLWQVKAQFMRVHGELPWWATSPRVQELIKQHQAAAAYDSDVARMKALEEHTIECPACGNEWPLERGDYERLADKLVAGGIVTAPDISMTDLLKVRSSLAMWEKEHAAAWRNAEPCEEPPLKTLRQIEAQRKALAMVPVSDAYKAIDLPPTRAAELRARQRWEDQYALWEQAVVREADFVWEEARLEEEVYGPVDYEANLAELRAQYEAALTYETRYEDWERAESIWQTKNDDLEGMKVEVDEHKKGQQTIQFLRAKIKTFLVPSLNVAASELISRMTGGQRRAINVDENFEIILVDGQTIETLSGSARAVANLAIRIGLGQVLTNRVFSVFMGDEIDASMDADRAGYTTECLNGLSTMIDQIILISHKDLPVQHKIRI